MKTRQGPPATQTLAPTRRVAFSSTGNLLLIATRGDKMGKTTIVREINRSDIAAYLASLKPDTGTPRKPEGLGNVPQ